MARYQESKPCSAVRDRESNSNPRVWLYRAKFIEQPPEDLPLIIGDYVHNLRSALDHLMAALSPSDRKRDVLFPIISNDIWTPNPDDGKEINRLTQLRRYDGIVNSIAPEANAIVTGLQPWFAPYEAKRHSLAILNALDNADKHYGLMNLSTRIVNPVTKLVVPGSENWLEERGEGGSIRDGGVLATFAIRPRDLKTYILNQQAVDHVIATLASGEADVNVEVTGCIRVGIALASGVGYIELPTALRELIDHVIRYVVEPLEPFIIP